MPVARSGKRGTVARGSSDKRRIRKQRLAWNKNADTDRVKNILVFDKFPYSMKMSKGNCEVGNGDDVGGVYIYNIDGLETYM
ncbi:MAG: hypothetical protein E7667_05780 [Ruminococcaceae bacterium]|nr:hypothetical protein [Oscillospiraceae bacterium]